jgi:hypothetical protein
MRKLYHRTEGNILVMTAVSMFSFMLLMSMAIDVSQVLTAKNQLQVAVDAGALAGASGLIQSQYEARNRAMAVGNKNNCLNGAVHIDYSDVTFPSSSRIRVWDIQRIQTYFAPIIGLNHIDITAQAIAELSVVSGTNGFRPFAVPDMHWVQGDQVLIKTDDKSAPSRTTCWHYPVDFPPLNRGTPETGASVYEDNIKHGTDEWVYLNDRLQLETGEMAGPTGQGVRYVIDQDPYARWNGTTISNSAFPGFSSPRVIKVPLIDSSITPDNGRSEVTVIGFATFFIVDVRGGKDVYAIFINVTTIGKPGGGTASNSIYMVRLVG